MENIFLLSLFNLAVGIVSLVAAVKMHQVSKKLEESIKITYFLYSFIFFTAYFLLNGITIAVVDNSFSLAVMRFAFYPLLVIGGMFLCLIPINLTRFKKVEIFYIFGVLLVILASSILTFLGLDKLGDFPYREIEYWIRPTNVFLFWSVLLLGITLLGSLLFSTAFYLRFAIKRRKHEVPFGKAIMIGGGCLFFSLAIFSDYFVGEFFREFIVTNTIATLLFIMGILMLVSSINYKGEKKKDYNHNN